MFFMKNFTEATKSVEGATDVDGAAAASAYPQWLVDMYDEMPHHEFVEMMD